MPLQGERLSRRAATASGPTGGASRVPDADARATAGLMWARGARLGAASPTGTLPAAPRSMMAASPAPPG